ncbi:hypothetical protein HZS_241 [Henneguya salminicola]|nr:hypothetical protein HZS_241 [Henneguya salminicola]
MEKITHLGYASKQLSSSQCNKVRVLPHCLSWKGYLAGDREAPIEKDQLDFTHPVRDKKKEYSSFNFSKCLIKYSWLLILYFVDLNVGNFALF